MKYQRLQLSAHTSLETSLDTNGRFWIAYSSGASVFIRDVKELRRFLKIPKGIQLRERLDAWLDELAAADTARRERKEAKEGLSEEVLATGFGPECHLDESDPNFATRTVI
jgi:hypothetical protein